MMLGMNTSGNTMIKQMESREEEVESRLLSQMGDQIQYTLAKVSGPNNGWIMARLKDKSKMKEFWKQLETLFPDTPTMKFWTDAWNPAELPIPNPPQLRIAVRGGDLAERARVTQNLAEAIESRQIYPRNSTNPIVSRREGIRLNLRPRAMVERGQRVKSSIHLIWPISCA